MNKLIIFPISLLSLLCLHGQTIGPCNKAIKNVPPPAKVAVSRAYQSGDERIDYFIEYEKDKRYVWSIRGLEWVPMPTSMFGISVGLINGPRVLRPGNIQEYVLACVSRYNGRPNYLWKREAASLNSSKLGEIYTDDEVEIEWEIRTSPGVRVVTRPELPSRLSYWEPVIAPFKIEVSGYSVQRVEIYVNGYRDGKLVSFSWIPLIINREGYSEAEEQREKKEFQDLKHSFETKEHMDWRSAPLSEFKVKRMKEEFESKHRLTKRYLTEGLRSGEFLTETEDPDRQ